MTTQVFNAGFFNKYTVDVIAGKSITVTREGHEPNTFKIGDQAEYASYNISYYGTIKSITEKTVTIAPRFGQGTKRLKLDTFAWQNYDFDLNDTIQSNANEMTNIFIRCIYKA